jgi:hypothetical protein
VEEVVVEKMKANKIIELFQTMAIMSLNMGNFTLEINTLNHRLVVGEKEMVVLQEKIDKKKDIQKGYTHNVEIWKKSKVKVE